MLASGPLEFPILRSSRRTIGVSIGPEEGLRVIAPLGASRREIDAVVAEKTEWIRRNLAAMETRQAGVMECGFGPGERVLYRGDEWPLVYALRDQLTFEFDQAPLRVEARQSQLRIVAGSTPLPEAVRAALEAWLQSEARRVLPPRVWHYARLFGVQPRRVLLSDARTRWGSLGSRGSIRLNWRLILAPPELADYVAAHEVCHLRHPHHRASFWRALATLDPEWRAHRAQLRAEGHRYELPELPTGRGRSST